MLLGYNGTGVDGQADLHRATAQLVRVAFTAVAANGPKVFKDLFISAKSGFAQAETLVL